MKGRPLGALSLHCFLADAADVLLTTVCIGLSAGHESADLIAYFSAAGVRPIQASVQSQCVHISRAGPSALLTHKTRPSAWPHPMSLPDHPTVSCCVPAARRRERTRPTTCWMWRAAQRRAHPRAPTLWSSTRQASDRQNMPQAAAGCRCTPFCAGNDAWLLGF